MKPDKRISAEVVKRTIEQKLRVKNLRIPKVLASRISCFSSTPRTTINYRPGKYLAFRSFWFGILESNDKFDFYVSRPDGIGLIVECRNVRRDRDLRNIDGQTGRLAYNGKKEA